MTASVAASAPTRLFAAPVLDLEVEVLPLREITLAGHPTELYVLLIIRSQAAGAAVSQVRLNLGLLLDKSQSMLGGPFTQATEGALAVMGQLAPSDRISILTFDESQESIVTQATTSALPEAAQKLRNVVIAGGRTDIGGALAAGGDALTANPKAHDALKVLLLTDGRPTAGEMETDELAKLAAGLRDKHISLSCIGLGIDYDEELLMRLAEAAGGYYYHSSRPRDIKKLFQREMASFKNIHLRDLELALSTPDGFAVAQVMNFDSRHENDAHVVRLPDLEKSEEMELLVRLQLDEHKAGLFKMLDWTLGCRPIGHDKRVTLTGYSHVQFSDDPGKLKGAGNHPRVDRALTVKNIQTHLLSTIQGLKTQTISRDQAYSELKDYQKTLVLKGRTYEAMELQTAIHHLGTGQEEEAVKELGASAFSLGRGPRELGPDDDSGD